MGFKQCFEEWAASWEDQLVTFDTLILANQGDISEVSITPDSGVLSSLHCVCKFSWKSSHLKRNLSSSMIFAPFVDVQNLVKLFRLGKKWPNMAQKERPKKNFPHPKKNDSTSWDVGALWHKLLECNCCSAIVGVQLMQCKCCREQLFQCNW